MTVTRCARLLGLLKLTENVLLSLKDAVFLLTDVQRVFPGVGGVQNPFRAYFYTAIDMLNVSNLDLAI